MSSTRSRTWSSAGLLVVASLLGAQACAGPAFDGTRYRGNGMAFRVGPVPEDWRPIEVEPSLLAFRDDSAGATIAVNGRCGEDGDDVPLRSLTQHLFLHFTERHVVSQRVVPMDDREALRTELVAKLDGVPMHFTVYVLKKDGCVYDLLHIADRSAAAEPVSFDRFVQEFATEALP